ncbi:pep-cterm sorting domain-containing protein [Anaeramoeba ignava]|uniref:Pep-cterm sorting domain-containing protein n=1 Tax=Anaeramoeba ignava TaxID=1746090 RepID=A0A9Q0LQB2_ANAIG|nr:pep-cterm sorting domain-containing protein [Anaeramoeba ignava]
METYSNLEKLSNDLKDLFQNQNQKEKEKGSYFDFEIICEQNKTSFKTHKSILSSRSEYFKSLFNSKMKKSQKNKLILKDVSSSILSSILNYFYSGKIEINLENAIQILIFSSKYLIDELIEFSSKFIKNNLQIKTVVDVLKLSESMDLNQLLDSSYKFILENFEEFIKTSHFLELEENHLNSILSNDDISINEFELFQSIIKWGKHKSNIIQQKEKLQNQISNVIDKIRFINFSKQELEDISKEKLIPNQISEKLIQFQKLQEEKNEKKLQEFIEKENQNKKSFIFKSRFRFDSEIVTENESINKLKEWINDNDFFSKMKKGFSAKRDGFSSQNWHKAVDDKGKTLVIIKTKDNYIFGGFTQVGFTTDKSKWNYNSRNIGWIGDPNSFIFSLRNGEGNRNPEKFTIKKGKKQNSIYYYLGAGPCFGADRYYSGDIYLNSSLQPGVSKFGKSYNLPDGIKYGTNQTKSYLAGSFNKWVVDELETYFI